MFINKNTNKIFTVQLCCLIAFCLFICAGNMFAQRANYKVRHITIKEGLSQSFVTCVFQDSRGFMWFGTQDGLNLYDGSKITVFSNDPENNQSLGSNSITNIIEDKFGRLWIGTRNNGLSIYFPRNNTFKTLKHNEKNEKTISNNSIAELFYDKQGTVWASTSNGFNAINPVTFEAHRYYIPASDSTNVMINDIKLVLPNSQNKQLLWVISAAGVFKFNTENEIFTPVIIPGMNEKKIYNVAYDHAHRVYINTVSNSLKILDINLNKILDYSALKGIQLFYRTNEAIQVTCAYRTKDSISYLGTDKKGVMVINEKTNELKVINAESPSNVLLSNKIQYMYFDSSGYMWVGTDFGVDFLQPGKFKFKNINNTDFKPGALASNDIMSILVDDNKLLLGTSNKGLNVIDRVSGQSIPVPNDIIYGSEGGVLSTLKDQEGNYWIGTWGGGLVKLNLQKKKFKQFLASNSILSGQNITCLAEQNNSIWIGTYDDGLFKIDKNDETFSKFTTNNGLSSNSVYCLAFDSQKRLWVGTNGGGITIFNRKTGKAESVFKYNESNKNSLSSNIVNCIYFDKNKVAWIATDNGLNKYDMPANYFTRYNLKDGLPNNYIYSILPDNNGNLWMSTNYGLSKFNPNVDNVEGSAFSNYGPEDGLQGEEFNQGAYYKANDGSLYFGGLNGVNTFHPDQITSSSHIPPVYITSYKRFNKEASIDTSISFKRHIHVSYKENSFAFEFTALDFDDPSRNRYSWKMEGLQSEWTPPTNRNIAEYPELSPGEYIFRVKASNSDGVWNNEGNYLYITVSPPWYKTSGAYTLFALSVLLIVFGYSHFRTMRVAQQKKVLERMVEQRTIQLAEKNRDITSSIEYARKIQDAILPPLKDIYRAFPESFVLYMPRDIVSGDFYWFYEKNNKKIIAVVDCTGHGVPGAFMSMIGHNLLNQIVIENGVSHADEILNLLHKGVQAALKQGQVGVESKDGMDVSLCVIDSKTNELQFAGAYRTLYILNELKAGAIQKITGDKFPIGGSQFDAERSFTPYSLKLYKGDTIYMFTDGFADQFGGDKGKKFMVRRFSGLLEGLWQYSMSEQKKKLDEAFNEWKGKNEQVDDVLVIGIKI